jgi:ribose-phosphate pyrophosphokinase
MLSFWQRCGKRTHGLRQFGILSGTNNLELSSDISKLLGNPLVHREITKYPDSEINVEILEQCHRRNMYVIQGLSKPVNDSFMELLLLLDALKHQCPREITLILPYLCYSRQDRITKPGTTVSASLIAKLIESVGNINKIVTLDLHSEPSVGFFHNTPIVNLQANDILVENLFRSMQDLTSLTVYYHQLHSS